MPELTKIAWHGGYPRPGCTDLVLDHHRLRAQNDPLKGWEQWLWMRYSSPEGPTGMTKIAWMGHYSSRAYAHLRCQKCDGEGGSMELCGSCDGSGEGWHDGSRCRACPGSRGMVAVKCDVCEGDGECR